jgi:photosystem II stability/assembly factor-like uncharacterized protein
MEIAFATILRMHRLAIFVAFLFVGWSEANAQWNIEESHTTASLRGIHNVGSGVAWASGTSGSVLRTEDGGYLWQPCNIPPGAEKLDFRGIQAFDENTAIVMSSGLGDLSRLYKTTDGCQTWKLLFTNPDKEGFWDAIKFVDRTRGYLLGDPVKDRFRVWRTMDSGETWQDQQDSLLTTFRANPLTQGAFAASNSALWVTNLDQTYVAFGTGGTAGAMVYSITRLALFSGGGRGTSRWETSVGDKTQSSGIFSIYFRYEGSFPVGIAVGGDYLKPDETTHTAAASTHGLGNWHLAQTPPHGYRSSVAYDPQQKLWITVGPNGTDISRDDGENWTPLKPSPQDPPDADKNWSALSLPFVVGPHGRIGKLNSKAPAP